MLPRPKQDLDSFLLKRYPRDGHDSPDLVASIQFARAELRRRGQTDHAWAKKDCMCRACIEHRNELAKLDRILDR